MRAQILPVIFLIAGFTSLACERGQNVAGGEAAAEVPAGAMTAELMVEGTSCASCSVGVRKALRNLDGVVGIREGQTKNHVLVDFMPGQVAAEQIVDAVSEAGFVAEVFVHSERS